MPTYAYQCESCKDSFEEFKMMKNRDEPTETPCKKCGGTIIRTPVSYGGFALNDAQPLSGDFKNLLQNLKRKNTTYSHKSTIGEF